MRQEQVTRVSSPAGDGRLGPLLPGRPLRLEGRGGWLTVVSGSVWLTRLDDFEDHWLSAGQAMRIDPARGLVVEAWDHAPAQIAWHAAQPVARAEGIARALSRRAAFALLPVARSFAALAEAVVRRLATATGAAGGDNARLGNDGGRADGRQRGGRGAGGAYA